MKTYFTGIDIGTSSTKVVAFTQEGHFLAKKTAAYPTHSPQTGWQEQDPENVFRTALAALRNLVLEMGAPPAFVAFSSAMHSVVAVDRQGKPLTALILWSDNRSAELAAGLKGTTAGKNIYRHTGTPVHPMSPLPKIAWLRENEPAVFQKTFKFIDIKTWLIFKLFGEYLTDYSMASATGLFDAQALEWYGPALGFAGITEEQLARPVSPFFVLKNLRSEFARYLGISPETPFVMGASDGCLANLGSGASSPGTAVLSIGTSGALRMTTDLPVYDAQERIFNYLLWDGAGERRPVFVTGGASNNGAVVYDWFTRQFYGKSPGAKSMETHRRALAAIPPGSDGLLFLPWIHGERAPIWNANARGIFFGATDQHSKAHFHRAVLEGILLNLSLIGQVLEEVVAPMAVVYANGGFTKMDSWVQMAADIFGKEVRIFDNEDAPALGAVITGMKALGLEGEFSKKEKPEVGLRVFVTDEANHRVYRERRAFFGKIHERIGELFDNFPFSSK